MRFQTFIVVTALSSLPLWAHAGMAQLEMKVQSIESLSANARTDSVANAFNRELKYAKSNFSQNQKVKAEANLYASNLQKIIIAAYEAELKETKGDALMAKARIIEFAEKDLAHAQAGIASDVKTLTMQTIEDYEQGGVSSEESEFSNVEEFVKKEIESREKILNDDGCCNDIQPKVNNSKDSDKKVFASKAELMESLLSERESARWVSQSNQTVRTARATKRDSKIGVSVQIPFLGTTGLSSSVTFKRETTTGATIISEGLHPVLQNDGTFDYWKRDRDGNVVVKNGVKVKRYISFTCDAERSFSNETAAGGSLSIGVPGFSASGEKTWTKVYTNSVNMASRRIALPEYVGGETVNVKSLTEICHSLFLSSKFSNKLTVDASLDIMMRNIIAGLEFSNTKTKCSVEEHCYDWFNNKIIGLAKIKNWPRCEQESEGFLNCKLKGLVGQNCPVIEKNTRISDGQWEFACDKGLKCVKYENIVYSSGRLETFLYDKVKKFAKGKCMPINAKTYKDPMTLQNERDGRYIEINFQD
jgi:hypothetical protein